MLIPAICNTNRIMEEAEDYMGISITNRPCERTAYYGEQRNTIQTNTKVNTPPACYTQDEVTISQMTRDTFEKEGERVDAVAAIDLSLIHI